MSDLVKWLRQQLDDDEREAREALSRQTTSRRMVQGRMTDVLNQPIPEWRRSVWPPARVLAEVDAKRRILDIHQPSEVPSGIYCLCCSDDPLDVEYPCPTVRALALPYADRPGYRDEWRQ